jgi:hypothetical protein
LSSTKEVDQQDDKTDLTASPMLDFSKETIDGRITQPLVAICGVIPSSRFKLLKKTHRINRTQRLVQRADASLSYLG